MEELKELKNLHSIQIAFKIAASKMLCSSPCDMVKNPLYGMVYILKMSF